eukprot:CAMPEP_0170646546 /NCGR_PEP_ID=MMETSP0224-20130122/43698_1 /TAXON_ID=285029 /ORGANISM="Togula jolla, Strain CCCM 725" /LENGTH=84 /DNA_ID=CAMNT_0010977891 /DNA_START=174 /DNA_END=428 /DNA_ORIENTATION=-
MGCSWPLASVVLLLEGDRGSASLSPAGTLRDARFCNGPGFVPERMRSRGSKSSRAAAMVKESTWETPMMLKASLRRELFTCVQG